MNGLSRPAQNSNFSAAQLPTLYSDSYGWFSVRTFGKQEKCTRTPFQISPDPIRSSAPTRTSTPAPGESCPVTRDLRILSHHPLAASIDAPFRSGAPSSRVGSSPPPIEARLQPPSEPYVRLSPHTALHQLLPGFSPIRKFPLMKELMAAST